MLLLILLACATSEGLDSCLSGPGVQVSMGCRLFDVDCAADGDVDLRDYAKLQQMWRVDRGGIVKARLWRLDGAPIDSAYTVTLDGTVEVWPLTDGRLRAEVGTWAGFVRGAP